MSKHKLVSTKDPKKVPAILREKSKEIKEITPEILDLAKQMIEIMNENKGIGLAAIQVGVPLRMMIIKDSEKDHIFINPEIRKLSKKECPYNEGCLSFPDIFEEVIRPEKVMVRAETIDGELMELETDGILARIFQHEIDHMEGVVFLDKVQSK